MYFLTITTILHHYVKLKLFENRIEEAQRIYYHAARFHENSRSSINGTHADNSKKFLLMRGDLNEMGINSTTVPRHTSESNGVAEIMNWTLSKKVKFMFKEFRIWNVYWSAVINYAVQLYKITTLKVIEKQIRYKIFLRKPLKKDEIRRDPVFGICTCSLSEQGLYVEWWSGCKGIFRFL